MFKLLMILIPLLISHAVCFGLGMKYKAWVLGKEQAAAEALKKAVSKL